MFQQIPTSQSGIDFENTLTENEDFNIIEYLYYFNGGGVAVGDINNDGFIDVYFTSNQKPNKLFLNKGKFQFEDITEKSKTGGIDNWSTGATIVDVNGDGLMDIYVCAVGGYKKFKGRNQLFINNGDLTFTDKAAEYGLNFQGLSTQASFFDYDQDGDLDMYLLNHSVHSVRSYGRSSSRLEKDSLSGDRLYRNNLMEGSTKFTNVTQESGIYSSHIGYGLGIATADINMDGLIDIYVSNDFRENDYVYLNRGNGKFEESITSMLSHSSRFSMGNDIADFNNDGFPDIITVDMMPKEERIIKSSVGEDSYEIYKYKLGYGYYNQVAHNALQLNLGNGHFSDIAWLSGVAATDWSWSPLMADFDNDGLKDLFVTNGIVRRPNDLDYLNFISSDSAQRLPDAELFKKMPSGKVGNYLFFNKGNLTFEDRSEAVGINSPSFSNGAAYGDLDNDGDLDLIVNNINQQAFVYRNTTQDSTRHYIKLDLLGPQKNTSAMGSKIFAFSKGNLIYQELSLTRGFESSTEDRINLGLGNVDQIDSLWLIWPDNKFQVLRNLQVDRIVKLLYFPTERKFNYEWLKKKPLLTRATLNDRPQFFHKENDFVSFNSQGLTPHMISTEGPAISVGDANNDGLDDFFAGGAKGQSGAIYLQKKEGGFFASSQKIFDVDSLCEDTGASWVDVDGDKDLDLIVVAGGEEELKTTAVMPRLYINDGKGNLKKSEDHLPEIYINASCVRAADYDNDGDIDLFLAGRVVPFQYGLSPSSFLLENDGKGIFSIASDKLPDGNDKLGMITDVAWIDLNMDGKLDLLMSGEWMPITLLIQDNGKFVNKTVDFGLDKTNGWWNALSVGDFDKDGDMDFVAGNLGVNSRLKANEGEPIELWVDDFDKNGSTEQILTYFNGGFSYPFVSRDQLVKQIPSMRKMFLKYESYTDAKIDNILTPEMKSHAEHKFIYQFESSYFENANGKLIRHSLPIETQISPIKSFLSDDINGDGNLDLLAVGNLYATQPDFGRYDASLGLVMIGDGKGGFTVLDQNASGFLVEGEGRLIVPLLTSKKEKIYVVARNNKPLLAFQVTKK